MKWAFLLDISKSDTFSNANNFQYLWSDQGIPQERNTEKLIL